MKVGDLVQVKYDVIVSKRWRGVKGMILDIQHGRTSEAVHEVIGDVDIMVYHPSADPTILWWGANCLAVINESR